MFAAGSVRIQAVALMATHAALQNKYDSTKKEISTLRKVEASFYELKATAKVTTKEKDVAHEALKQLQEEHRVLVGEVKSPSFCCSLTHSSIHSSIYSYVHFFDLIFCRLHVWEWNWILFALQLYAHLSLFMYLFMITYDD